MVTPICQVCLTIIYNDVGPFSIMLSIYEFRKLNYLRRRKFWLDRFPSLPRADQKKSHLCFALFSTNADLCDSYLFFVSVLGILVARCFETTRFKIG